MRWNAEIWIGPTTERLEYINLSCNSLASNLLFRRSKQPANFLIPLNLQLSVGKGGSCNTLQ
jgi:hypothetical protein